MPSDDELVSRITKEVVSRLGPGQPTSHPGVRETPGGHEDHGDHEPHEGHKGGVAVVISSAGRDRPGILDDIRALSKCHGDLFIVVSRLARYKVDMYQLRQSAGKARVMLGDSLDGPGTSDVLDKVANLYIPDLDLDGLIKLDQDAASGDRAVELVLKGMEAGKKVTTHTRNLRDNKGTQVGSMPEPMKGTYCGMMARLEERGMRFNDGSMTEAGAESHTSQKSHTSVQPDPSSQEHKSACSLLMNGGECESCGLCVEKRTDTVTKIIETGAARIGASTGAHPVDPELAHMIDHTILKPDATEEQIRKLCQEALEFGFASVCINPHWVPVCHEMLKGSRVMVCTVIGFPLGATTSATKAAEAAEAIANGAQEIDMVINVGALKSGNDELVRKDIEAVVHAARGKAHVKVILETALLTSEEKVRACLLAKMAGADFVKTSTGFGPGGATVEDIALMRKTVGPEMGVKASGGIRDTAAAKAMVEAGASRIGASASVAIVKGG